MLRYPTYRHIDSHIVQWNGESWVFTNTAGRVAGKLTEAEKSIPQVYPGDGHDWRHLLDDGTVVVYNNVPLKCSRTLLFVLLSVYMLTSFCLSGTRPHLNLATNIA